MSDKTINDIINQELQKDASEYQIGGDHYLNMPVQPWDVIKATLSDAEWIGFLKGNVIKYSMRADRKPNSDDWAKARHYMEKLKKENTGWNF